MQTVQTDEAAGTSRDRSDEVEALQQTQYQQDSDEQEDNAGNNSETGRHVCISSVKLAKTEGLNTPAAVQSLLDNKLQVLK